jgi:aspartyl-tRNA(Asn)/glutamyl-tRNA(Gln) amidotransferase subunit C
MTSKLTKEDIKHIAHLAKLEFSDNELERFEKEFNSILEYVSMIKECDTSGIEFEHNLSDYNSAVLQDDIVKPGLTRDKALQNATGRTKVGFVVTSKIINKDE